MHRLLRTTLAPMAVVALLAFTTAAPALAGPTSGFATGAVDLARQARAASTAKDASATFSSDSPAVGAHAAAVGAGYRMANPDAPGPVAYGPLTMESLLAPFAGLPDLKLPPAQTPEYILGLQEAVRVMGPAAGPGTNQTQEEGNATQFAGAANGTQTHHHANIGQQGLNPVWAATFHGIPSRILVLDANGDGVDDAIVGSDIAVSAYDGKSLTLLWARHLGNRVTSLYATDGNADGKMDVGYATFGGAQTARVGLLKAATGDVMWEHIGQASFLVAGPASESAGADILAADVLGNHVRLSAGSGEEVFAARPELLPDTNLIAADHSNDGHYLAMLADLTGDGTKDIVSVSVVVDYVLLVADNIQSVLYATDGASGALLWLHDVAPDPAYIHQNIITGLTAADVQGDGTPDVAFAYRDYRYEYVPMVTPTLVPLYDNGVRVIDGGSTLVGRPLGTRTLITPELPVESFLDAVAWDLDGDGKDEVATLHTFLVDSLLGAEPMNLEVYAFAQGAVPHPTMAVLSDVKIPTNTGRIVRVQTPDGVELGVSSFDGLTGHFARIQPGGATGEPIQTPGDIIVTAHANGGALTTGSMRGVQLRPDGKAPASSVAMRGTPLAIQVGDHDGDGHDDFWVSASDGQVHVVDGVTGAHLADTTYGEPGGYGAFQLADIDGDGGTDVQLLRLGAEGYQLEAWKADGSSRIFSKRLADPPFFSVPWLDGNGDGVQDVLTFSYFEGFTLYNGVDGGSLWTAADLKWPDGSTISYNYRSGKLHYGGAGEDLLLFDSYPAQFVIVSGATGAMSRSEDLEGDDLTTSVVCFGAVDTDGDGTQSVLVTMNAYTSSGGTASRTRIFHPGGGGSGLSFFDAGLRVAGCSYGTYGPLADGGYDVMVAGGSYGEGAKGGFGRFDPRTNNYVWNRFSEKGAIEQGAYQFLGSDPTAVPDGRVYEAYQDHVYGLYASNGTVFGEFTPNGPFIRLGILSDLDLKAPEEVIVQSTDGILWALTDKQFEVAQALAEAAKAAGKEVPGSFAPSLPKEQKEELAAQVAGEGGTKAPKKTPGIELGLLAVGLAGLAVMLRRRSAP